MVAKNIKTVLEEMRKLQGWDPEARTSLLGREHGPQSVAKVIADLNEMRSRGFMVVYVEGSPGDK